MKIPRFAKTLAVGMGLFQGLVIMHELVHRAIFKYFGVASKIEIGIFWGQVTPEQFVMDASANSSMMLAHCINECILPICILLIVAVMVMVYRAEKEQTIGL